MSDDEADPELLELLRQHFLGRPSTVDPDLDTGVLASAEHVTDNAIDVALDMRACKNAAEAIYSQMKRKHYSTATWGEHELHPTARDESTVDFVFAMDLLNFSFWVDEPEGSTATRTITLPGRRAPAAAPPPPPPGSPRRSGFAVEYRGKTWTGYYSMVAALRRALDEGIPITSPAFWCSPRCDMALMRRVFRPAGCGDVAPWRGGAEQKDDVIMENGKSGASGADAVAGELSEETARLAIAEPGESAGPAGEIPAEEVPVNGLSSEKLGAETVQPSANTEEVNRTVNGTEAAGEAQQSAEDGTGDVNGHANGQEVANGTTDTENAVNGAKVPVEHTPSPATTDEPWSGLPEMPLLTERLACLKEAGQVLTERFGGRAANLLDAAGGSAAKLVNILAREFACFRDECPFPEGGRHKVRFLKRAQILAAELWACFQGAGYGAFRDVDKLTMFADYRVPQILQALGCLYYSPPLRSAIEAKRLLPSGSSWEVQLRGCTIWCVELIRREIRRNHPDAEVNAVLIDFFLYDTMKEMEAEGKEVLPHHRTRSIWY